MQAEGAVVMWDATITPRPYMKHRITITVFASVLAVDTFPSYLIFDFFLKKKNLRLGDNYMGSVDQGDTYNGNITNSAVGGRGNSNHITNNNTSRPGRQLISSRETTTDVGCRHP